MQDVLHFSVSLSLLLCIFLSVLLSFLKNRTRSSNFPVSYPIIGSIFAIAENRERRVQWISELVTSTPNLTYTLHRPFGYRQIFTANPANVQHILKSHFYNYPKGEFFRNSLRDFMGDGIFNADGENWKFQRQVSSHQFNTKSLRNFVEHVVDGELNDRLIPVLKTAAAQRTVLDFQDILQRFAFDNICKIAFGYDPEYLLQSLPEAEFAVVFNHALQLVSERFNSDIPFVWKIKRAFGIGSEKQLKMTVTQVREFAKKIIQKKNQEMSKENGKTLFDSEDLLSRFLISGYKDQDFIMDIVISFILAGRDTTSAALTWFFWLIFKHPEIENEIIKEIKENSENQQPVYDEVKTMVYIHASLCEAMRLYPPVPLSTKFAKSDDLLPDGTVVKKGTRIAYHPYAMGRAEQLWGKDWAEFRPMRWLEREEKTGKWCFVGRDSFSYPVFQAGPRICLGKEMAFLQMKRIVAGVLRRFKVVPAAEGREEPVYVSDFTSKMKGGFNVRIEERVCN